MYTLTNGIDKIATDAALIRSINIGSDSTNLLFQNIGLKMLKCGSALFFARKFGPDILFAPKKGLDN